jgi:hypothetical protein
VVEQSLWAAVPSFLRRLSTALKKHTGRELPLRATPIRFGSWMGGDRDGNPNVTAKTTHHVVALSRWVCVDTVVALGCQPAQHWLSAGFGGGGGEAGGSRAGKHVKSHMPVGCGQLGGLCLSWV